jgi:hypothetical protein
LFVFCSFYNEVVIHQLDEIVYIVATCQKDGAHKLVPKIMEWQGRTYRFTCLGFRHPTQRGKRMLHVFDMADETHSYRLEFDAESLLWKLRSISDGMSG